MSNIRKTEIKKKEYKRIKEKIIVTSKLVKINVSPMMSLTSWQRFSKLLLLINHSIVHLFANIKCTQIHVVIYIGVFS